MLEKPQPNDAARHARLSTVEDPSSGDSNYFGSSTAGSCAHSHKTLARGAAEITICESHVIDCCIVWSSWHAV